ncbi:Sec-independent protein translocase protein TatB [Commensalibacter nepenthis]|uniref:Sec-independent protein translocase protein TatB n=1 Tax=Commensalibacter nepenthis TaxID=3043872 RepID=A0ABT6QA80_9PROT|nr:Sec-independent protein translocase protein TatB [Commensalibacter sp. TBRC 10068]MDI2113220.1 Sec-independent protein translocase protein TatB [Commensalibacter sp. TBRC 10068]
MFGFSWAELLLIGVVAMVFIGPKDFPKVLKWLSDVIKKCRKMASEFHSQVDEVIKDPDLKEAKDQLLQLRNLNVKTAILNTIDRDGSLQNTLRDSPLSQTAMSSPATDYSEIAQGEIKPIPGMVDETSNEWEVEKEIDYEALEAKDPAPSFFPPHIAQRLQVRRAAPPSPAMIPPHISKYKEQRWS